MARRQRLDLELVQRGLAASRQQAQQLIRAGKVRSGDRILDKPGVEVAPELVLQVERPPRFVSRGGDKLVAALEALPIPVQGRVCLDGGISTGGFTDCLLQHGARRVYGIDVGYSQTAWSLRNDPRVVLRERTNLRHLHPEQLYGPDDPWPDLAVADVSFISLTRVLPALWRLLGGSDPVALAGGNPPQPAPAALDAARQAVATPSRGREALLLIKPQFEVGRERVGRGGVVRDPQAHREAIETVIAAAAPLGWLAAALLASPITGPAGNHEYLLWLREDGAWLRADSEPPAGQGNPAAATSPTPLPAAATTLNAPADGLTESPPVVRASVVRAPVNAAAIAALVDHTLSQHR